MTWRKHLEDLKRDSAWIIHRENVIHSVPHSLRDTSWSWFRSYRKMLVIYVVKHPIYPVFSYFNMDTRPVLIWTCIQCIRFTVANSHNHILCWSKVHLVLLMYDFSDESFLSWNVKIENSCPILFPSKKWN